MTRAELKRLDAIARAGCVICGSPAEIHHVRRSGMKRKNAPVFPLCPTHHRTGGYGVAVHCGRKGWEINHGTEAHFVELTLKRLEGDR